jgi:hypothetical protein
MKAHELNKTIVQLIGKLIDKPLSNGEIEYAPETYKFLIEELRKNLEHMKEKERNWIANSAFMLLLICDVILNTLRDERPNLVDVLESRFH